MFLPDVLTYKQFYASPLGAVVRHSLRNLLRRLWKPSNDVILGLGYAPPCLQAFEGQSARLIACMPAAQGVIHWPGLHHTRSLLADETELPFANQSVDKLILTHMLEHSFAPLHLLEECWRVLAPGGKLLILAPNRRGIWARMDHTPLGHGRPFSRPQLKSLLEENRFTPLRSGMMLFYPPTENRFILKYAPYFDAIGSRLFVLFGGWLWMEAEKEVYAIHKQAIPSRRTRPSYIPAQPVPDFSHKSLRVSLRATIRDTGRGARSR